MKVLYFHQHFSTPKGATGNRSYWMARQLVERGHNVTMVCGSYRVGNTGLSGAFKWGRRTGLVDKIEIVEFNLEYTNRYGFVRRSLVFAQFACRSILLALFKDFDVVFATSTPLTAGLPGVAARWIRRKFFVFEVRDLWPDLPVAMGVIKSPVVIRALGLLEIITYRSANRLVGLSPGIVEGIMKRGVASGAIAEIPNGCDIEMFDRGYERWRPAAITDADFLAIYAGTHGLANGLGAVLDAASELQSRGRSDIKILLVGDGMQKAELQDRTRRQGLRNVVFLEPIDKTILVGLLHSADIGLQILGNVSAFYYGTSPNKFFDYIAAGLPVLNNYPGWVASMIAEFNCGYVVQPNDAVAFADSLERAASAPEELTEMGENARVLAEQKFDRARLAEKFVMWLEGAGNLETST